MDCLRCACWRDKQQVIDGVLYVGYCNGYPNLYYTDEQLTCDIGCDYFE